MTETVVKGLTFVPYLSEAEITKQVNRVAQEIVESLGDEKSPIFVCVLNGAYVFLQTDLFRACNLPEAEITFIRFKKLRRHIVNRRGKRGDGACRKS
ncbi:MAG: hypothetical protein L6U16_09805 [Porphyromonadaceae bacterium]|nr:MAG: hypothetical protein L6U16_09805 [Porphyromonadaceae bacterium]